MGRLEDRAELESKWLSCGGKASVCESWVLRPGIEPHSKVAMKGREYVSVAGKGTPFRAPGHSLQHPS